MEQMANVYLFGKKYVVPASLTIMEAMEYCGYRLVRGCGCRNGFCGACVWRSEHILRGCVYCVVHIIFFYTEKYKKKNLHYFRLHFLLFVTQL